MKLKATMTASICVSIILSQSIDIYADYSMDESPKLYENLVLENEVTINGVYENSTIYVGSSIPIYAYSKDEALNGEILWKLTGEYSVLDLSILKNTAELRALTKGDVEVMAYINDGSDISRSIMLHIEDYPKDELSQSMLSDGIVPIQKKNINGLEDILQVEVNRDIQLWNDKVNIIDSYLKKLAMIGTLSLLEKNTEDNRYDFYTINISNKNNIKLEIRVDKLDESCKGIIDKIENIDKYNNLSEETVDPKPPIDPNPPISPEIPENPNPLIDENIITQGLDDIIIVSGDGSSIDSPAVIEVNKNINSKEKIKVMETYLGLLKINNILEILEIKEDEDYTYYKIKVTQRLIEKYGIKELKNDFYIEIRVDKNDEDSYEPIIEMLSEINIQDDVNEENNDLKDEADISKDDYIEEDDNESINVEDGNKLNKEDKIDITNSSIVELLYEEVKKDDNHTKKNPENKSNDKEDIIEDEFQIDKGIIVATIAGGSISGIYTMSSSNRNRYKNKRY